MEIRFWGVRGSIASPGPRTARVGGNTSCVEVREGGARVVLDAGTGLRGLGEALVAEGAATSDVTLLLSHYHWDHVQGLPFFAPLYLPGARVTVAGAPSGVLHVRAALAQQMQAPLFPVDLDELPCELATRDVRPGRPFEIGDEVHVTAARLQHPGGVTAYRLEAGGASVVYATDTEHPACLDPALVRLAEGADVLVYDAQYTPEEYDGRAGRAKVGWGHSTYAAAAEVAAAAGVGELVLFHHDPSRADDEVFALEARARALFPRTRAACEGLLLRLEGRGRSAA